MKNSLLTLLAVATVAAWASPGRSVLESGVHCVAYKAEKIVFFVSKSSVVGRNCDISAQVLPEVGGLYHIEVNIPIRSFDSGDADRDHDVMHLLKSDERPELTFRTAALTAEQWKLLFAKSDFEIEGQLFIGSKSFTLKMRSHYFEKDGAAEVDGVAVVRYEDLGLAPPKVMGGVVAKAKPDVELHFHLQGQRILGADSLRPNMRHEG